jgi:hypothetical protein
MGLNIDSELMIKYVKRNKIKLLFLILFVTLTILAINISIEYHKYNNINDNKNINEERKYANKYALPLIEDNSKYIELQTKKWIEQRKNGEPCYGLLEKDKIIMSKWMTMFNIKGPKIHYFNYHNDFKIGDLYKIVKENPNKRLVLKISHLQSNFGIIIIPPNPSSEKINKIYKQCQEKFKSCFVCNHDRSNAPTHKEIKDGKKKTHYELYQTIEPGVIIQDFFYSNKEKPTEPEEFKILVLGDKIINSGPNDIERMKYVHQEARRISKLLGSTLIRVDFFVKYSDNPYIPYLNEISLSPANGLFVSKAVSWSGKIDEYKDEISKYEGVDMPEIDKLISEAPVRSIPISKYMTDNEHLIFKNEKFRF